MHANYRVQDHQYNYLVMTADVLKSINDEAIKEGYNRTLKRGFFSIEDGIKYNETTERIVIDTYPIQCTLAMPHYHKSGVLTMPHVRAVFSVPTVDVDTYISGKDIVSTLQWESVTVDIKGSTWEKIPTIRPYAWLDIPEATTYEKEIYKQAEDKFANDTEATIADIEQYLAKSEKDYLNRLSSTEEE